MSHHTAGRRGVAKFGFHVRHNLVAYVALFFALSGGAFAANNYIRSSDTISGGDLDGSTYGSPVIAANKVTNGKLANSSLSVNSGTGLSGGGSVALGASTTLGVAPGGINTAQLHDGSVTTAKFDSGAQAPDSAKLGGKSPSDYGAVLSGRINGLSDVTGAADFGPVSGVSTASSTIDGLETLSPNHDLVAHDLSVRLTAPTDALSVRQVYLVIDGAPVNICNIGLSQTNNASCTNPGPIAIPANSALAIFETMIGTAPGTDMLFAFRLTP